MPNLTTLRDAIQSFFTRGGGGQYNRKLAEVMKAAGQATAAKATKALADRLLSYYYRDRPEITGYIRDQASKTFGAESGDWQLPLINSVARTVKRLSMAYRKPPTRKYYREGAAGGKRVEIEPESDDFKKIERMYGGNLKRLNRRFREMDAKRTLLNTIHVEPIYRNGQIDFDIHTAANVTVIETPGDYLSFDQWGAKMSFSDSDGKKAEGWRYWDEELHAFLRDDGRLFPLIGNDIANPWKGQTLEHSARPIPIVPLRKVEDRTYWGRYGADMVDAVEQSMIQLGNLWENVFLQAHGQAVAVNCGFDKDRTPGAKVKIGPKNPIAKDGVSKDDLPPDLKFAQPDPNITAIKEMVDWFITMNGSSYGLPPSAWAEEESALSGYAKAIDNLELTEQRDEELVDWIEVEQALHEWSVLIFNACHPKKDEHVDENIRLDVLFDEVEFPKSPQEEALAWQTEITLLGTASPVDFLMKKHKISSRKEAMELAKSIAKENAELAKMGVQPVMPFGNDPDKDDPKDKDGDDDDGDE